MVIHEHTPYIVSKVSHLDVRNRWSFEEHLNYMAKEGYKLKEITIGTELYQDTICVWERQERRSLSIKNALKRFVKQQALKFTSHANTNSTTR